MKSAIIFGGSGYIARFLIEMCLDKSMFDKYIVFDIKPLLNFDEQIQEAKISFFQTDVRNKIQSLDLEFDKEKSWIFNFAAIHREPGHAYQEYFDTNVRGAENINEFARNSGIKNLFFTSSIAPYGRSLDIRTENSPLYPETAYGISKGFAEKIHQEWLAEDKSRRLIIVRPSVIFGPKDPGNVYRMIKALQKGTFILPNGGNIIKGYGYVYGLVESMLFTIQKMDRLIIYNYAENPVVPLKDMVKIIKEELGYNKPTITLSVKTLAFIAFFVEKGSRLMGKKSDIHPVRVKKAGFPTNIRPQYLIDNDFNFKYDFKKALKHWRSVKNEDFQ
ncbi:NAD-dependent epimerase/dehydratase family protein [Mariniflexile aquimaris]|uniref:NAD-dependent epimerase/dehydratase family protein n=1 Tax=Mariniflexile aquimaris TaxID=881009 RepID=A0ABW3BQK8_9FLAO